MKKSVLISEYEFFTYCEQMGSRNLNLQRSGAQNLFNELAKGRIISRHYAKKAEKHLTPLLSSSNSKVKKWAYHLAAYINTPSIISICLKQLKEETNYENINWILAALSTQYSKKELTEIVKFASRFNPCLNSINGKRLNSSIALFSKEPLTSLEIQELSRLSSPSLQELSWSTKLYGYGQLAAHRQISIPQGFMIDLTSCSDPNLQEYGMWSLYTHGNFFPSDLSKKLGSPSDYENDTLKWYFLLQGQAMHQAIDPQFVCCQLRSASENHFNRSAQEGLAKFLFQIPCHPDYVPFIIRWYQLQLDDSVRQILTAYFIENAHNNSDGSFLELLNQEIRNDSQTRKYICNYIYKHPDLPVQLTPDSPFQRLVLHLSFVPVLVPNIILSPQGDPTKGDLIMAKYNLPNAKYVQIVEKAENVSQVGSASSQIPLSDLSKVLEEISKQPLSEELQEELKSIRQDLSNQKSVPFNKLNHFASILADYITIAPVAIPALSGLFAQLQTYLGPL